MAKEKSEREIAREILKHLRSKGILCFRHEPNTYNHTLGQHVSNPYVMAGAPDIIAILPGGIFCGVEVKTPKGKQSPDQILFQKRLERAGGVYIVARSIEDVQKLSTPSLDLPL